MSVYCPQCGAPSNSNTGKCEYCGAALPMPQQQPPVQQYQQPPMQQQYQQPMYQQPQVVINNGGFNERSNWPIKNKMVAGILAILLGGIGVHKFYLGNAAAGILYLLFCWTGIPAIIALIEGISILCQSNDAFETKFRVRNG